MNTKANSIIKTNLPGEYKTLDELLNSNVTNEVKKRFIKDCIEVALKKL